MVYYWFRLPEDEKPALLEAVEGNDFVSVVQIINRFRISPDRVTMCCGAAEAMEESRKFLDDEN